MRFIKDCVLMELLLISGYKPHLALLGWYNDGVGVVGFTLEG